MFNIVLSVMKNKLSVTSVLRNWTVTSLGEAAAVEKNAEHK